MSVVNQKRIAKNTALLYVRMLFIMLISLYTSRVILETLGDIDFGLYNVIGGIVVTFSFLNGVMGSACSRYFAIEIGRGDSEALRRVFNLNVTIFLLLGVIILVLAETIGLWFLNHKMQIPPDRMVAAQWVYQCSIVAFIINMFVTPYRSVITARENMKVYAYCSVVEVVLKLAIVYVLVISPIDKLILYSILMVGITVGTGLFYALYCRHYYNECRYSFYWDKPLFKEIVGYTGWQVIGVASDIGRNQGVNIILNMFFGPIANTARGIAYQVFANINQFVQNFVIAFSPQITKSYAIGDREGMMKLVFQSSKFSYYLLYILILPVCLETPKILEIWLGEVPDDTVIFCQLTLIAALIDSLLYPLLTAVRATGKVKWYQISVGGTQLLTLPICYAMFKWGDYPATAAFYVVIATSVVAQIFRVAIMKRLHRMSIKDYFFALLKPILLVTFLAAILPIALKTIIPATFWGTVLNIGISMISVGVVVLLVGVTSTERIHILEVVRKFIRRKGTHAND